MDRNAYFENDSSSQTIAFSKSVWKSLSTSSIFLLRLFNLSPAQSIAEPQGRCMQEKKNKCCYKLSGSICAKDSDEESCDRNISPMKGFLLWWYLLSAFFANGKKSKKFRLQFEIRFAKVELNKYAMRNEHTKYQGASPIEWSFVITSMFSSDTF